jgi:hypothetical protein
MLVKNPQQINTLGAVLLSRLTHINCGRKLVVRRGFERIGAGTMPPTGVHHVQEYLHRH